MIGRMRPPVADVSRCSTTSTVGILDSNIVKERIHRKEMKRYQDGVPYLVPYVRLPDVLAVYEFSVTFPGNLNKTKALMILHTVYQAVQALPTGRPAPANS